MEFCPKCHRRLLSHTSAKCNWCGCEIEDPAYQAKAEVGRAAFLAEEARHDIQSLAWSRMTNAYGYGGGLGVVDPWAVMPLNMQIIARQAQRRIDMAAEIRLAAQQHRMQTAVPDSAIPSPESQSLSNQPSTPELPEIDAETERFRRLEL